MSPPADLLTTTSAAASADVATFTAAIRARVRESGAWRKVRRALADDQLPLAIEGPQAGYLPFFAADVMAAAGAPLLVVVPTEQEAEALVADLTLLAGVDALHFPWWGTLPYAAASPLPAVFGRRADVLATLAHDPAGRRVVVVSLRALSTPVPPATYLRRRVLELTPGMELDPVAVEEQLVSFGYIRVPRVSVHGEFSVKGEVIDVYPHGHDHAIRAVLEFDSIDELRSFDPLSQASVAEEPACRIHPVREVHIAGPELQRLEAAMKESRLPPEESATFLEAVSRDPDARGAEAFYPLCVEAVQLTELLGPEACLLLSDAERLEAAAGALRKEYTELYRQAVRDGRFGPMPKSFLLDYRGLVDAHRRRLSVHSLKGGPGEERPRIACDGPRSFFGNVAYLKDELNRLVELE